MTEKEALKLALEALKQIDEAMPFPVAKLAIMEAEKALAQPEHKKCENCGEFGECCQEQPEQELTTNLEASVHAGLDKKNDKNPQVDHQGKQPEQEPVAHTLNCVCGAVWDIKADGSEEMVHTPDTTPPQRTWVGLTDEEMHACWDSPLTPLGMKHARMIEAKLKEKNT